MKKANDLRLPELETNLGALTKEEVIDIFLGTLGHILDSSNPTHANLVETLITGTKKDPTPKGEQALGYSKQLTKSKRPEIICMEKGASLQDMVESLLNHIDEYTCNVEQADIENAILVLRQLGLYLTSSEYPIILVTDVNEIVLSWVSDKSASTGLLAMFGNSRVVLSTKNDGNINSTAPFSLGVDGLTSAELSIVIDGITTVLHGAVNVQ